MITDPLKPLLLFAVELLPAVTAIKCSLHSLLSGKERFFLTSRVFDHRDDIDEGFVDNAPCAPSEDYQR